MSHPTDRIRLHWDDEWSQRPVFRDVEHTANGTRVSKTKVLDYSKHRHHLIRLGRTCGFEKRLEFYDVRRASGKRLNGKFLAFPSPFPQTTTLLSREFLFRLGYSCATTEALNPEECRQIMGNRGDVYEQYYMPSFVDRNCQAIYLGSTQ